jgi:glutamyl-tRNA synthetase
LRIEDIDSPRVKAGAAESAIEDLRWLGLDWDGDAVVQTDRLPLYEKALEELKQHQRVYPCTCSRTDIERAASAPHADHEAPPYPGTCSRRSVADAASLGDKPFAWRFRASKAFSEYGDLFRGIMTDADKFGGDFVVWKSAGTPAYQLAVVVDDAACGVNEVIRGDDLVPSTPRQLQLYDALGLHPPVFCHVPLVVGPDGRRLAKRHGDARLKSLREAGVTAETLIGFLAWSCGWQSAQTPISARDLIPSFRLDTIPRSAFVLQPNHLRNIAGGREV